LGIIVMKFGASAVSDAEGIRVVADIVRQAVASSGEGEERDSALAVVSALSGVTDSLFAAAAAAKDGDLSVARRVCAELRESHKAIAREISSAASGETEAEIDSIVAALDSRLQGVRLVGELSDRNMDEIAAAGERLASILVALALGAPSLDARPMLRTDSRFGRARPDQASINRLVSERLKPLLSPGRIAVTQGYIGSDSLGSTTTLGRGAPIIPPAFSERRWEPRKSASGPKWKGSSPATPMW
jgi:aspartate kinase